MRNLTVRGGLAVVVVAISAAGLAGALWGQNTAPVGDTGQSLTMESAFLAVRMTALKSPNPYVRAMAYHDRDEDWSINLKAGTFSVKIHELQDKVVTGKVQPAGPDAVAATFDDEQTLSREWIVPADAVLTAEEATRCLAQVGERLPAPDHLYPPSPRLLKTLCAAMKGVELKTDAATGQITGSARTSSPTRMIDWSINLRERTFDVRSSQASAETSTRCDFSGRFGWDKDRKWTAWPIEMTAGNQTRIDQGVVSAGRSTQPVIPEQNIARGKTARASNALLEHAAAAANDDDAGSFWQPAINGDATWTVDLKSTVLLSGITITKISDAGGWPATIHVSDDEQNWRDVTVPMGRGVGRSTWGRLPVNTAARFVRLSFRPPVRGAADNPLQVSEVRIDGTILPR